MRHFVTVTVFLWFCGLLSGCFGGAGGRPVSAVFNGKVTKVHDGDSVHITPTGKKRVIIRLAAIDAPEIKQSHGINSRDYLRNMIMNKQVTARCNKVDKYQRQVCVVLNNGTDTNLEMLKAGQAWYYERFRDEQPRNEQRSYRKAASNAKKRQAGLWRDGTAIPPWEFRAQANN